MTRVRLNGVVVEDWPQNLDESYLLSPGGPSGWYESTEVRREEVELPMSHGSFNLPGYMSQRLIGVPGHILASSAAQRIHMQDRLTGLLADGGSGRLTVDDDAGTRWADVRLAGCQVEVLDETSARFLLQLWAADPRKYGETRSFASGEPAYHYGNFPASPVLEVPGARSSWTASAGSAQVSVSQALTSSQTHRYDARTGRLTRNGALQVGVVTRGDSWTVAPGQQLVHTVAGGAGRVLLTDTFI